MTSRKAFLKFTAILMAVCFLVQAVTAAGNAVNETQKEVIVSKGIEQEKSQLISDAVSGEQIISRGNILCKLGHNLSHTTAFLVEHRYYPTAPRCLETVYDVYYCNRSGCDYISCTELGVSRIFCCS
ncbi:MAG: hypothetical protein FWF82_05200 [Oscillospiraceae bacterium]|jgi:hypothetical protein|nr:hypothetical protein [Oscillospiraceae bacterium]